MLVASIRSVLFVIQNWTERHYEQIIFNKQMTLNPFKQKTLKEQ